MHAGPKYGGTLVVGVAGAEPDSLDPTVSRVGTATSIYASTCDRLYELDAKLQLVPELAAALPAISKDKLSYTIQLRKDAVFNDGTPFNAQAVVTTAQRFMTHPLSSRATDYASVESIIATGPYSVVFRMKARDSTFVANPWVLSPTQLAKLGDAFASDPICVGPFVFDHRVVGDHTTVVKSPHYYDKAHVYLDKIVYRFLPDGPAAAAALKAGDIQALTQVSPTELSSVRQSSSLRVVQAPQLGWRGVIINIGNKNGLGNLPYTNLGTPFAASAKLRQAFEEALDRATLNRVVFGGLYQPSCTLIAPANTPWFEATKVPCAPYDPNHARKLVAASGVSNPTVRLLVTSVTDELRLTQFIQAQEAAVGINVVIEPSDNPNSRRIPGNFDMSIGGNVPGDPDPHGNIAGWVATSGTRNYGGYSSPRLDLILANGTKATDPKARSTLYRAAQQLIASERPVIALYNPVTFAAFSSSLAGMELAPRGNLSVQHARYR